MRTVGKRRIEKDEATAHDLQRAAAQFVGPEGLCDRGLYRFRSFDEADAWMMAQKLRRARARRRPPMSPESPTG